MKYIILALLMLSTTTSIAIETFCAGLSTPEQVDNSNLEVFKKEICKIALKSCYSSFSLYEECTELYGDDYTIILLSKSETIEADYPNKYNYDEPNKNVVAYCENAVGFYTSTSDSQATDEDFTTTKFTVPYTVQNIRAKGAYQESEMGCVKLVDRIVSPDESLLETNPNRGPELGEYKIMYSIPDNQQYRTVDVQIIDTTPPKITVLNEVITFNATDKHQHTLRITDNYRLTYGQMIVKTLFLDDADQVIKEVSMSYAGSDVWEVDSLTPPNTTTIEYYAKDKQNNVKVSSNSVQYVPLYTLIVLATPDTIEAAYPSRYDYYEKNATISSLCLYPTPQHQAINFTGAYKISGAGCLAGVTRVVHPNGNLFEQDPVKGPTVNNYSITYSIAGTTKIHSNTIVIRDTTAPKLTLKELSYEYNGDTLIKDTVQITDNYYPSYQSMNVKIKHKAPNGNVLQTTNMSYMSGKDWYAEYKIIPGVSKLEYVVTDSQGNKTSKTIPVTYVADYKLVVISLPDKIHVSYPDSYNYPEPYESIDSTCHYPTTHSQSIMALGAYKISEMGCIGTVSRKISPNDSVFETNPKTGPLIGKYKFKYWIPESGAEETIIVEIYDKVNPVVGTILHTQNYDGVTFQDQVTVTDNYKAGYTDMQVIVDHRDGSGKTLLRSPLIYLFNNEWGIEHYIPEGTKESVFSAEDMGWNTASKTRARPSYK